MRLGSIIALAVLLVLSGSATSAPKAQKECPEGLDADGKEELLRKAPSCDAAMELFEACAYGASGDTGLSEAVIENCEKNFAGRLSAAQRKTYDAEVKRCDAKARGGREGTMYISAAAFCRAGVAQNYARRFAKLKK
jgi:hypothetical protein